MQPQPEIEGVTIVLLGRFTPEIFHPSWFQLHDLILDQEAEAADVHSTNVENNTTKTQLVHPEAAIFQAEWLRIHVVRERFVAATTQRQQYEPLRDLVLGTFELLEHTPLRVVGINCDFHYPLESKQAWNELGHRLAPKEDWGSLLIEPGMLSLTMEGKRPDDFEGYIRVKVEPSARVQFGVYVNINDHYQPPGTSDEPPGAREIMKIISQQWEPSIERSREIAQTIASLGDE